MSTVQLNKQVLYATVAALEQDIDSVSWLCGYLASEINDVSDNDKSHKPISLLSKLLLKSGMVLFEDFMPYTGCRISIINQEKFESLPPTVRAAVEKSFEVMETSSEEVQKMSEALLREMEVG
ncbi:hypothetical protein AB0758_33035 [Tolypothrix bouteillei VB521301_2]|uniref:Uncharacterized protein n=1 Tax=Tolypothrix bouteillei VB521301 TaxID=1479485 RepID=A0A8S9SXK5_9CYAN|nr:hypothetical protein [Tolypothrix bouteillei]KAF3884082.1 hypothetical protein DA73_0400000115 [Tolypothrix bouteillei VB521301]